MGNSTRWYTWVALVCACWFALTSWMWWWLINLFISYPVGVLALILWWVGRVKKAENKAQKAVFWLLVGGWLVSIIAAALMF